MPTKVIMPQLGESVVEGTVSKWLKRVGDSIEAFEPLLEISTDKVDTEVSAPASGVILQIYVPEGTTVERGVLLAMIGQPGEAVPDAPAAGAAKVGVAARDTSSQDQGHALTASSNGEHNSQRFSPVVARMAAQNNLDLSRISGTGLGGRVTKKDVEAYLASDKAGAKANGAVEVPPWEQPISGDLVKSTYEIFAKAKRHSVQPHNAPPGTPRSTHHPVP